MKKIVAFIGSARKQGYCAAMVNAIRKGAESLDAEVTVYTVPDMDIKGCRGCMYCRQGKGCAIRDDMAPVYDALKTADAVVFAAPIYFGLIPGHCLTLLNRLYPLLSSDGKPAFGQKKAVMIYTYGAPGDLSYQKYIEETAPLLSSFGFDIQETIVCSSTSASPAAERADLMDRAFAAGKALAE